MTVQASFPVQGGKPAFFCTLPQTLHSVRPADGRMSETVRPPRRKPERRAVKTVRITCRSLSPDWRYRTFRLSGRFFPAMHIVFVPSFSCCPAGRTCVKIGERGAVFLLSPWRLAPDIIYLWLLTRMLNKRVAMRKGDNTEHLILKAAEEECKKARQKKNSGRDPEKPGEQQESESHQKQHKE